MNEGSIRRWIFEPLDDGIKSDRVCMYSLSSFVNGMPTDLIQRSVIKKSQIHGSDIDLIDTVSSTGQLTSTIGDTDQEPKVSMTPNGLVVSEEVLDAGYGAPFQNLVIEAVYRNESLRGLRTKLAQWMHLTLTSVQVAISIKTVAILGRRGLEMARSPWC